MSRAVVLMSGGDAATPFTTPEAACRSGLAAGNTATALREHLLGAGYQVFTAPAHNGRGVVRDPDPTSFGAFGDQPEVLGEQYTVNSDGDIDLAGEHLARFVTLLHYRYDVDEVDFIGHSNGGLFSRSAIRLMAMIGAPVRTRSLVTLGTPWMGAAPLRWVFGEVSDADVNLAMLPAGLGDGLKKHLAQKDLGLAAENTYHYLVGPDGWNEAQGAALDGIPTLLIGGTYFTSATGDPELWPNDGIVTDYSARAQGLPASVVPQATRMSFNVTHSIFVSNLAQLPWDTGMTWNPDVLAAVTGFLA